MSDWKDNFIRDGVTQQGFIAEQDGIHGSLLFSYRPMLGQHAELYADMIDKLMLQDPEKAYLKTVDVVSDYTTDWDQDRPLSKESIRIIKKRLLIRMYSIIRGEQKSDPIPGSEGNIIARTGDQILGKS